MRLFGLTLLILLSVGLAPGLGVAQKKDPPKPPDQAVLADLTARADALARALDQLRQQGHDPAHLDDVAVFERAVRMTLLHGEFLQADSAKWTAAVLDQGQARAAALAQNRTPWLAQPGKSVVRAYRSRVDGTVQPYAISLPEGYGRDPKGKSYRLDIVLHGRDSTLTEVKFINAHDGKPAPKDRDFVQVDVFGRGNNAYRWAGETDVFEGLADVLRREQQLIDQQRIVLRGFSMGGAGAWHIGLRYPSQWAVIGPGAGFSTTRGYIKNLPEPLPDEISKCLHIYDAVDYAENAANVPIVAYAGEKDAQIQAGRNVEKRLAELGLAQRMQFLIAPNTEHSMPAEWAKQAEAAYRLHVGPGKGRVACPASVRFVTWTLASNRCDWVELLGLTQHYRQARVLAQRSADHPARVELTTNNVTALRLHDLAGAAEVIVDQQKLPVPAGSGPTLTLVRTAEKWVVGELPAGLRKRPGLHGPIDDAFRAGFVCAGPTGPGWHAATDTYARADLARFGREWSKWLRGDLPVVPADQLTEAMLREKHLVLFGDPQSNPLIAKVLPNLPIRWTRDKLTVNAVDYDPAQHVPVLIYPNPLNPTKYVVLNSGHTFHEAEFKGTNAGLYPRLGDYAVLRVGERAKDAVAERVTAGLFDETWRFVQ